MQVIVTAPKLDSQRRTQIQRIFDAFEQGFVGSLRDVLDRDQIRGLWETQGHWTGYDYRHQSWVDVRVLAD